MNVKQNLIKKFSLSPSDVFNSTKPKDSSFTFIDDKRKAANSHISEAGTS